MSGYYFTFRALTTAQRAAHTLLRAGIEARVLRAPKAVSRQGCGYCVFIYAEPHRAKIELAKEKLAWQRVYLQMPDGRWEEA